MNADEQRALATMYAAWQTSSLQDAVSGRRGEYDPQALELIRMELAKRGALAQGTVLPDGLLTHGLPTAVSADKLSENTPRLYIPYVGAWGLNYLLAFLFAIPLAIVLKVLCGGGPSCEGEAFIVMLLSIILGGLVSFLAFKCSVKWMIVDRLLARPKNGTTRVETQRPTGGD